MVERAGLENRCTASRYRGFESHLLRFFWSKSVDIIKCQLSERVIPHRDSTSIMNRIGQTD